MLSRSFTRLALAWVLMALPAALPRAATPAPEAPPAQDALTGQLLVAAPEIGDPRFAETVILLVRHGSGGAFGLIINRPVEERSLASLLGAVGEDAHDVKGRVRIFAGGPVEPLTGFVLHSAEYKRPETVTIDGRLAMTSSRDVLRDMGQGKGPQKSLVAFGYAGWAPGQLEAELAHRDWFVVHADPSLVFDADRSRLWKQAMARRSLDL